MLRRQCPPTVGQARCSRMCKHSATRWADALTREMAGKEALICGLASHTSSFRASVSHGHRHQGPAGKPRLIIHYRLHKVSGALALVQVLPTGPAEVQKQLLPQLCPSPSTSSPGCETGTDTGRFLLSSGSLVSISKKETKHWLCSDATQEDKSSLIYLWFIFECW